MAKIEYEDKKKLYNDNFSLGYFNTKCSDKFVLIGLICYLTHKFQQDKPGVTHYKVIMTLNQDDSIPQDLVESLSIICEDFAYGCKEFPTFGVEEKDMPKTIKKLLKSYMPF